MGAGRARRKPEVDVGARRRDLLPPPIYQDLEEPPWAAEDPGTRFCAAPKSRHRLDGHRIALQIPWCDNRTRIRFADTCRAERRGCVVPSPAPAKRNRHGCRGFGPALPRERRNETMMQHKGYYAKTFIDEDGKLIHGELNGLRAVVTFQGRSVEDAEAAFHDSVDDCLDWCATRGNEPEKPFPGRFNVRIDPDSMPRQPWPPRVWAFPSTALWKRRSTHASMTLRLLPDRHAPPSKASFRPHSTTQRHVCDRILRLIVKRAQDVFPLCHGEG